MEKTYLELLAENDEEARKEFPENAKDLLTANFVEYDDQVEGHDHHPDELVDQHEFQKPQGSHQLAGLMPEPTKDIHKTTTSVRYDKDVKIHVISIDSRFRADQGSNPSNFLFKMLSPIKNVISVRLSSLEIPNTWYAFSSIRGNTSMLVSVDYLPVGTPPPPVINDKTQYVLAYQQARFVIEEGNYSVNTGDDNDLLIHLYNVLNGNTIIGINTYGLTGVTFSVILDPISGKLSIGCFEDNTFPLKDPTQPISPYNPQLTAFDYYNQPTFLDPAVSPRPYGCPKPLNFFINFADGRFSTRDYNWGLGYNLGYRVYQTDVAYVQTASSVIDVIDSNYVFLSLNPDWRVVEHNQPDSSQTAAFAKIIVDVPKNSIVYDSGSNTITKQYYLRQPTNIASFNISITDEYDQYVQLEGGNVSMTLEVTEVLHASLFEAMREH